MVDGYRALGNLEDLEALLDLDIRRLVLVGVLRV
jgi:hypothetical protein